MGEIKCSRSLHSVPDLFTPFHSHNFGFCKPLIKTQRDAYLDANQGTFVLNDLCEEIPVISFLVHGLMEEDHTTDARVDTGICGEEQLPVETAVFFCVFGANGLQAFGNAA